MQTIREMAEEIILVYRERDELQALVENLDGILYQIHAIAENCAGSSAQALRGRLSTIRAQARAGMEQARASPPEQARAGEE